jgi:DNA processing protein
VRAASLDRLALSLVIEPGDPRLRDLLAHHDTGRVLDSVLHRGTPSDLTIPEAWVERATTLDRRLATVVDRAKVAGLRWICPGDRDWPSALDDLDQVEPFHGATGAPLGLWLRGVGDLAELCEQSVAIVGARACTTYGAECASEVAGDCADADHTVVSGAAFGIDSCAHRGALVMRKPTVAVLASGADIDYPKAHAGLIARIAESGLVVSEQAPGESPMKGRFLSRNRLIAALTRGTVVIEAARRSGSLNTLHWADQLGRLTMGLPGPITSQQSAGVHAAIRGGEAVLVGNGRDVVEELGGLGSASADEVGQPSTDFDRLAPAAQRTLDGLEWGRGRSVGEIASAVRLTTREVLRSLDLLERRGYVARLEAGWVLVRRADVG